MATYTTFLNYVNSPTADTVETLLDISESDRTIATIVITNTGSTSAEVAAYLYDSNDDKVFTLLPTYTLASSASQSPDIRSLNLPAGYQVKVLSDSSDVEFCASGVVITE
jgi:hypothetical protein